jgi:tetratricopeptide (TPR) repeat protein
MSVNRIIPVGIMALWLAGCESLPAPEQSVAQIPPAQVKAPAERASPLYSDIVYSVLAGDIAAQRNEPQEAFKYYLYAAKLARRPELAELAARAALSAQDEAAARRAVALWLELDPESLPALQISALLYAQAGDLERAVAEFLRVTDMLNRSGRNGFLEVARLLAKVSRGDLRLHLMRRLAEGRENDADALFALALVEVGSHHFAEGEAVTRRVLALRPRWDEARVLLVRVLGAQNKQREARAALERFLADRPDDSKLRAAYARLLVEQGELDAARVQFETLLRTDPTDGDTLFALGILAMQEERNRQAIGYLERLYELGAHREDAAFYLGQIQEAQGRPQEALRWYARVGGSKTFEARVRSARIRAEQGEIGRAREMLQQMRGQMGKEASQVDLVEAEILSDLKQYQAAIDVLTSALGREPDNEDLLYSRALVAVNLDRMDILERDLHKILEQDPNHADALNALGYTLADQTDRYQEALGYISRAFALKPDSAAVLDSMGWVQYRLGNRPDALRYLWRAMEALPDAEIASHLGEVLWEEGERERAREVWRSALEREPGSEYILRIMERYGEAP